MLTQTTEERGLRTDSALPRRGGGCTIIIISGKELRGTRLRGQLGNKDPWAQAHVERNPTRCPRHAQTEATGTRQERAQGRARCEQKGVHVPVLAVRNLLTQT